MHNTTISILGCGWYGLSLAKTLVQQGYPVKGSTTTPSKLSELKSHNIQPYLLNLEQDEPSFDRSFFKCNVLIVAIPPKRSTSQQDTYPTKIRHIALAAEQESVKNIIFISSTSVYGDSNEDLNEQSIPKPSTPSGKAILESEQILLSNTSFTTTIIRFAGLIGPDRDPGRFFAGKTDIPNGLAPINLIHLDDCIGIMMCILQNKAFGDIYHACTPDHPPKQEFYTAAANKAGLPLPAFREELLTWKTISSKNLPSIVKYNYLINNWTDWLAAR